MSKIVCMFRAVREIDQVVVIRSKLDVWLNNIVVYIAGHQDRKEQQPLWKCWKINKISNISEKFICFLTMRCIGFVNIKINLNLNTSIPYITSTTIGGAIEMEGLRLWPLQNVFFKLKFYVFQVKKWNLIVLYSWF